MHPSSIVGSRGDPSNDAGGHHIWRRHYPVLLGLQREAEQCVEREGVIQYWVNGQSYTIRRTDITKIDGPCPSADVPSAQGSAPSVGTQSRPSPAELPPLLLAAKEGRVQDVNSLLIRGTLANQRGASPRSRGTCPSPRSAAGIGRPSTG